MSLSTTNALAPPTQLCGGVYTVAQVLGQGGFGITYLCHDAPLNRSVAIKEFYPEGCLRQGDSVVPSALLSPTEYASFKDRFIEEARVLARFHHPGIVNVHTFFEGNNTAYMVMEYLHGKTLLQVIEGRSVVPEHEALDYIDKVGEALMVVHASGLIHRDIKPSNIMKCEDGRVLLIDFGLSKPEMTPGYGTMQLTRRDPMGTSGYSPPEQYTHHAQMGVAADIYALGATLYHLLTGKGPVAATERALADIELITPSRLRPQLSRTVSDAVMDAMALKASERPQSVQEFLVKLRDTGKSQISASNYSHPTTPAAPLPVTQASPVLPNLQPFTIHATPNPPSRATATPLPSSANSNAQAHSIWTWAAFGLAMLVFWLPPGLHLWIGIAAVVCGSISWSKERRLRVGAILGIVIGGWFTVMAPKPLPSSDKAATNSTSNSGALTKVPPAPHLTTTTNHAVADHGYKVVNEFNAGMPDDVVAALKKVQVPPPPANMKVPHKARVRLVTSKGIVTVELDGKAAPLHVKSFLYLSQRGFFDGTLYHRYEPGFVIQGGDPLTRTNVSRDFHGQGGPGYQIPREKNSLRHEQFVLAAARTNDPNSAGSQFYITLESMPFLDEGDGFTVVGKVVQGHSVVMKLRSGDLLRKATVVAR